MLLALAWPIFISSALAFQAMDDACRRLAAGTSFDGGSGVDWVRLDLDLALARAVEEEDYARAAQVQADLALLQRCQTEALATELLHRCKCVHREQLPDGATLSGGAPADGRGGLGRGR